MTTKRVHERPHTRGNSRSVSIGARFRVFLRRNASAIRSGAIFVAGYLGLLLLFVRFGGFVDEFAMDTTAEITARLLTVLGARGEVHGEAFVVSSLATIQIILECTAVFPCMLFVAGVLAFPGGLRPKVVGLGIGLPVILAVNELRLISLFYLGHWFPERFEDFHVVVWQPLMVFVTLALWLAWTARFGERPGGAHD